MFKHTSGAHEPVQMHGQFELHAHNPMPIKSQIKRLINKKNNVNNSYETQKYAIGDYEIRK